MNTEIRSRSWQVFKANAGILIGTTFLYLLISSLPSAIPCIGFIATIIIVPPMMMGLIHMSLCVSYGQKVDVGVLFEYFKNKRLGKSMGVYYLMFLFIWLWSLLFYIPGIIKSYSYAMTPYIWHDNEYMRASDCIDESKRLMDGNKWKLFMCELPYYLCMLPGVIVYFISFIPVFLTYSNKGDSVFASGKGVFMGTFGFIIAYVLMFASSIIVTPLLLVVRANFFLEITRPYREQAPVRDYDQPYSDSYAGGYAGSQPTSADSYAGAGQSASNDSYAGGYAGSSQPTSTNGYAGSGASTDSYAGAGQSASNDSYAGSSQPISTNGYAGSGASTDSYAGAGQSASSGSDASTSGMGSSDQTSGGNDW